MGALLFISHSGADTDDAVRLRAAILAHPAAVEAGLRVWLDKTDLVPGQPWQRQISDALDQARAFCVLIGARGIVNWVDNEVSVALDRATGPGAIAFVPVRASGAVPFERLPPFVRQYHGVTDPLGNPDALTALVLAATRAEQPEAAQPVTDRPFVGLQPMDEAEADRFFGRTAELQALSATVQTHPITAIVADSGAGKSSLVRAGLVPAFRGGRLAEPDDPGAKDRIRIVLSMRPGADPLEGLRQAQDAAMVRLGLDYADRAALRADLQVEDPAKAAFAMTCGVPPERADLLLVVDQFEELLTQTDMAEASEFVAFLLALSQPSAHRSVKIVLTVRNDYFNLIRRHPALFQALTADGGAAQLRLRALAPEALAEIVLRPLAMAGHRDQNDQQALLAAIRAEISDRPGDLALVQIALEAAWERHRETGEPLSQAYTAVGGLRGALDTTAEKVRAGLSAGEQSTLPALLVRLVRLGDTGGATRRPAALGDLDDARRALAQKLAEPGQRRLLQTSETSAEISHEALFRQWPWLQDFLQSHARAIRILGRFAEQSTAWIGGGRRWHALPNAADYALFSALAKAQPDWPTGPERRMLGRARLKRRLTVAGLATVLLAVLATTVEAILSQHAALTAAEDANRMRIAETEARQDAQASQRLANEARRSAERNASGALAALAQIEAEKPGGDPVTAARLALSSWPTTPGSQKPQIRSVPEVLSRITPRLMNRPWEAEPELGDATGVASPTGTHVAVEIGGIVRLILRATGETLLRQPLDPGSHAFAFSADGRWFAATREARTAMVWDLKTMAARVPLGGASPVTAVAFSRDSAQVGLASLDGHVLLHDLGTGATLHRHRIVGLEVPTHIALRPGGTAFAVHDRAGWIRVYDWTDGRLLVEQAFDAKVTGLAYAPDGSELWVSHVETRPDAEVAGGLPMASAKDLRPRLARLNAADLKAALPSPDGDAHGPDFTVLWSLINADRLARLTREAGANAWLSLTRHFIDQPQIVGADVGPSGTLATASRGNQVALTTVDPVRTTTLWRQSGAPAVDVILDADSGLNAVQADGTLRPLAKDRATASFMGVEGIADADFIDFSANGAFFVRSRRLELAVARTGDGSVFWHPPSAGVQPFTAMAVSDDGHRVALVLQDGSLAVRRSDGSARTILPPGSGAIVAEKMVFSGDGRLLAVGGGLARQSGLTVWDTDTGEVVFQGAPASGALIGLSFFPDGRTLLAQWTNRAAYMMNLTGGAVPPSSQPVPGEALSSGRRAHVIAPDRAVIEAVDGLAIVDLQTQSVLQSLPMNGALDGGFDRRNWGSLLGFDPASGEMLTWHRRTRQIGRWRYDVPEGSAFQVICALLPKEDHGAGTRRIAAAYPVDIRADLCPEGADPPLPSWIPQVQEHVPDSDDPTPAGTQRRAEIAPGKP